VAHGAWTDTAFIECIHENWPHVISRWSVPGISPDQLTDAQRATLRRKHCNATVAMRDGTVYLPPGGGQMCSGTAMQVRVDADRARFAVQTWEAALLQNEVEIRAKATAAGIRPPDPWAFRLVLEHGVGFAVPREGPDELRVFLGQLG
jgi:hypothetical protein